MFNSHKHEWSKWKDVSWKVWGAIEGVDFPMYRKVLKRSLVQQRECKDCGKKQLETVTV